MTIIYSAICRGKDAAILVEKFSRTGCTTDDYSDMTEAGRVVEEDTTNSNISLVTLSFMRHVRDNPNNHNIIKNGETKTFAQSNDSNKNGCGSGFFGTDLLNEFIESTCHYSLDTDQENTNNQDTFYFHVMLKDGIYYICVSDNPEARNQKVSYAFLDKICELFVKEYTRRNIMNINPFGYQTKFQSNLTMTMHYYNLNEEKLSRDENISKLLTKIENMKDIMGKNIIILYNRGENLQSLVQMSDEVRADTSVFKKRTAVFKTTQKYKYWYNWQFKWIVYIFTFLLFLYLLSAGICGWTYHRCKISMNS